MLRSFLYNTKTPLKIAHRGCKPENKIKGFSQSIQDGCDMIELDVRLSKDNVPMIIHDKTIDRTTTSTGKVRHLTKQELSKHDIPSFEELVLFLQNHPDIFLAIELKYINQDKNKVMLDKVHDIIRKHDVQNKSILISFDTDILIESKRHFPELLTAFVYGPYYIRNPVWLYYQSKADVLWIHYKLLHHINDNSIPTCVWTINSKDEVQKLLETRDVMGILTDDLNSLTST